MTFEEKINQLRGIIKEKITPLITGDYVLWDVPYYGNIGDILIWEGECQFLSSLSYKCLQSSASWTWRRKPLSPATVILLHGGGNFGDLWRSSQIFRMYIIENYPDNPIVMFPQSVWYNDSSLIKRDAAIMAKHKNLFLCARDSWSYEFMKKHFSANHILLIPDMAFCISEIKLSTYRYGNDCRKLYFKRIDKELDLNTLINVTDEVDIHDWPSLEKPDLKFLSFFWAGKLYRMMHKLKLSPIMYSKLIDLYAYSIMRPDLVKRGCEFLRHYNHIITTRLHALILSVLLHKSVEYIDNTTGKLSAFVSTWLSDLNDVKSFKNISSVF